MERYKCRICLKSFINGRALGGHMRSHMLNLTSSKHDLYDQEEERPSQLLDDTELDTSSDDDEIDNLKRSSHDLDHDGPTRKRSKRTRKLGSFDGIVAEQPEHHSSASDTTTEEDLAFCLIMLSRDKWKQQEVEEEQEETDYECEDYKSSKNIKGGRGRFKCETCGKVFKSYQALGGHRASHKKNKTFTKTEQEMRREFVVDHDHGVVVKEKKVHQCPICFRVFSSGQALGGHKRSHGSNNNNNIGGRGLMSLNHQEEQVLVIKERMIDLNLPAPNEDDDDNDDDETSLVFDEW